MKTYFKVGFSEAHKLQSAVAITVNPRNRDGVTFSLRKTWLNAGFRWGLQTRGTVRLIGQESRPHSNVAFLTFGLNPYDVKPSGATAEWHTSHIT